MAKTTEQLLQQAVQIRDEHANKKNTALRVGTLFSDIIEKQEESDQTHATDVTKINEAVTENREKISELEGAIGNLTITKQLSDVSSDTYIVGSNDKAGWLLGQVDSFYYNAQVITDLWRFVVFYENGYISYHIIVDGEHVINAIPEHGSITGVSVYLKSGGTDSINLTVKVNITPRIEALEKGIYDIKDKKSNTINLNILSPGNYTLQEAVNKANELISKEQKKEGINLIFIDSDNNLNEYELQNNKQFTNVTNWKNNKLDTRLFDKHILPISLVFDIAELIDNIEVKVVSDINVQDKYSIGIFGYSSSYASNICQIYKNDRVIGILKFSDAELVAQNTFDGIEIKITVKSFVLNTYGSTPNFDYKDYNIISSQLFINAYDIYNRETLDTSVKLIKDTIQNVSNSLISIEKKIYKSSIISVPITIKTEDGTNGFWNRSGYWISDDTRRGSEKISVQEGQIYKVSTAIGGSSVISYLAQWNGETFVGIPDDFKENTGNAVDRKYIVPAGVTEIAICSYDTTEPSLKREDLSDETNFYTKEETDSAIYKFIENHNRYGVKWSIIDANDLGQRVFNAVGLTAEIGIGSTNGHSDFDNIYPWSEIKRCNVNKLDSGAVIVTFEGDEGFSLDGTNGDVFVRVPKFSVDKYIKDGEEYRVIHNGGYNIHPAFIENGKALNEVFVSAFDGSIIESKMRSISNSRPLNNITANTMLDAAKANGKGYSMYDMRTVDMIWTLMAVEYGCRNSNRILGYGLSDFWQGIADYYDGTSLKAINSGTVNEIVINYGSINSIAKYFRIGEQILICQNGNQRDIIAYRKITNIINDTENTNLTVQFDGEPVTINDTCFIGAAPQLTNWCELCPQPLSWHTGRGNVTSLGLEAETINACRYRWIENVVGNVWHYLPDVTFLNRQMYVCSNMSDYEMFKTDGAYKAIGNIFESQSSNGNKSDYPNYNYWISSLLTDYIANKKGITIGVSWDKTLTSTKGFGGYYYLYDEVDTPYIIANGGGFDHLWRCNMLTHRAWINTWERWYLYGGRLIFKIIE